MNTLFLWFSLLGFMFITTQSRSLQKDSSPQDVRKTALFKALEARFLKMLGLTKKPVIKANAKVPQYLLDLYNEHVEDEDYITTNIASKDFTTTANVARVFYHTDHPNEVASTRRTKRHVAIGVGSVPRHEQLVKAEFRIYRNASRKLDYPKHVINVYQILQPGVGGQSVKRLLDSRVVDAKSQGWDSYDILEAVRDWRDRPVENHGLEVAIMSENGNPVDISHLRFDKLQDLDDEAIWPHRRPLLVVYTKDSETHYHKERTKRGARRDNSRQDSLCRRHEMKVNFTKLGWNWITAPKDYPAYYCKGECVFPMAEHMNTTNHAIVQTLVHNNLKKKKKNVPPPACCIPTSYEALGIIYYDNATLPVYKRFKEMIATGCGCR